MVEAGLAGPASVGQGPRLSTSLSRMGRQNHPDKSRRHWFCGVIVSRRNGIGSRGVSIGHDLMVDGLDVRTGSSG